MIKDLMIEQAGAMYQWAYDLCALLIGGAAAGGNGSIGDIGKWNVRLNC